MKHATQGHPESPRLWEKHINKILKKLHFTNTTHEQNIYTTHIQGYKVLFLQQVDDFAVACSEEDIIEIIEAHNGVRM